MKKFISIFFVMLLVTYGCGGGVEEEPATSTAEKPAGVTVQYTAPEPSPVPEYQEPESDSDWVNIVNNKEIEIIQVLNIINPVAVYITAGFEQYGARITNQTVHEEWADTQVQLTRALNLYESCKKRKSEGIADKQLFLDLEDTWQMLVKTGVAGVRTQAMLNAELMKLK